MTTEDLIAKIHRQNPLISQEQIQEKLESERVRTGGLFGDETLLRLIAAKLGVNIPQSQRKNTGVLSTSRLLVGFNDVTVEGRIVAVFPVKVFQGEEKSGKLASLLLSDYEGIIRVVLWDSKAESVEKGELKSGQHVKFLHGYTKQDRSGKIELHLGGKSQIEFKSESDFPSIEKFSSKVGDLSRNSGVVNLAGEIKAILAKKNFFREDDKEGVVLRLAFRDESGEATVVAWNEKAVELESLIKKDHRVILINARLKESQNGDLEVHVDTNTFIEKVK
jgi:ssDNA-binding replication factor A large subunit